MKCCKVQVYLAGKPKENYYAVRAAMSFNMTWEVEELASVGYDWVWILTEDLGLYPAYLLLKRLHLLPWSKWSLDWQNDHRIRKIRYWMKKEKWLQKYGVKILPKENPEVIPELGTGLMGETYQIISAIVRGRNLYFSEIFNGLQEMGFVQFSPESVKRNLLKSLVYNRVELVPSNIPAENICLRCGHSELQPGQCGICGEKIWFCPECTNMGESLSCRPLFRRGDLTSLTKQFIFSGNSLHKEFLEKEIKYAVNYSFPLSSYQKRISNRLKEGILKSNIKIWLLWAVCGAGKTETTFEIISTILQKGGRILFTSPRREIIRQLVERLGTAFKDVSLVGLYGGSEYKLIQAQITVATVHQLVRFYQAFDLIIFDEIDAYPYQGDQRLVQLLQRSLKSEGKMILLSATPDNTLLKEAKAGRIQVLTLPARFHRKGVPLPELISQKLPSIPNYVAMPEQVKNWITLSVEKDMAQLFIFLPTRNMVETFGKSLQLFYAKSGLAGWVEYTHSQDVGRSKKVKAFLEGDYPILVTTTILERGVTVPKSNVLVLYADWEEIFNHKSLIQMAGRGGRSLYAPFAQVWFIGKRISKEMKVAFQWIQKMNKLARERGLLD